MQDETVPLSAPAPPAPVLATVETAHPEEPPRPEYVPEPRRHRRPPRRWPVVLGALIVVAAACLPWVEMRFGQTAFAFPVTFPFSGATGRTVSMGLMLLALAALVLVASAAPDGRWFRRVVAVALFALPVGFVVQGVIATDAAGLFSTLGPGVYVALAGALLALLA